MRRESGIEDRDGREQRENRATGRIEVGEPRGERRALRLRARLRRTAVALAKAATACHYNRLVTAGKSRHTGTPQKCVPSVQRGEMSPLRITHGGPM